MPDITNRIDLRGRRVVAAIDYRSTRIYAVDAPRHSRPEQVVAEDPGLLNHNLYHHRNNPDGDYNVDRVATADYFRTIAEALAPAEKVLLLGHGSGKSNASVAFHTYLKDHAPDVAVKIVASVGADVDDITNNQLLQLGETYFGENVPRRRLPGTG